MFGFRKGIQGTAPQAPPEETAQSPTPPVEGPPSLLPEKLQNRARKLNLVGNQQLAVAIGEAVREGLGRHFPLEPEQLAELVASIGKELLQKLKTSSRSVRGLPKDAFLKEVEADKRRIEAEREKARKELENLLKQLQDRRAEFNQAEEDMMREALANARAQDRDLSERISGLFANVDGAGDLSQIQNQITALALQSLQDERDKALEKQMLEHRTEVQHFERRISKLSQSLELTEDELRRIAAAKNIDIGVGSIYRTVQGLSSADDDFETKKELMISIFRANLQLQKGEAQDE